jgi:hypothetical protein
MLEFKDLKDSGIKKMSISISNQGRGVAAGRIMVY